MSKSPGSICEQFKRCGKPNCRCNSGELHGPYHYHFYRDALGRQGKKYIKRDDVPAKRAQLAAEKAEIETQELLIQSLVESFNLPKRERRYDLLTSVTRSMKAIDRFLNGPIQQPRDKAGRFVKG